MVLCHVGSPALNKNVSWLVDVSGMNGLYSNYLEMPDREQQVSHFSVKFSLISHAHCNQACNITDLQYHILTWELDAHKGVYTYSVGVHFVYLPSTVNIKVKLTTACDVHQQVRDSHNALASLHTSASYVISVKFHHQEMVACHLLTIICVTTKNAALNQS